MNDSQSNKQSLLFESWLQAKAEEAKASRKRREIEDKLSAFVDHNQGSSKTNNFDGYQVKVTSRYNRKIDVARLREIAAEQGTSEYLSHLFRWKPDMDAVQWKATDESITRPLLDAITTTLGRPTYTIVRKEVVED